MIDAMSLSKHAQDAIDAWDDVTDIMFMDSMSDPPVQDVAARLEALQRLRLAMRRMDEAAGELNPGNQLRHRGSRRRAPGCQCHWEEGDSPCRVHGEDEGR